MEKITAIIVTYNPDTSVLMKAIMAIYYQVNDILIIDNGSNNFTKIKKLLGSNTKYSKIKIYKLRSNMGLPYALNLGITRALKKEPAWILTLDQDTIIKQRIIRTILYQYGKLPDDIRNAVGILAMKSSTNKNIGINKLFGGESLLENRIGTFCYKNYAITSGNLVKSKLLISGLRFNNNLFIDFVDLDFNFRIRRAGYIILEYVVIGMSHIVGILDKNNVSFEPLPRIYYIARNATYLMSYQKFPIRFGIYNIFLWCIIYLRVKGISTMPRLLKVVFLGIYDGLTGKMGKSKMAVT
jgi:rhamnosyltransferase